MDVREIIISEFRDTLIRRRINVTPRLLQAAESPFNLESVQEAVDKDIDAYVRGVFQALRKRQMIAQREKYHEERIRKLSRQYALQITSAASRGFEITTSRALNEQRTLKAEAGRGCDVYPCEQQLRRR